MMSTSQCLFHTHLSTHTLPCTRSTTISGMTLAASVTKYTLEPLGTALATGGSTQAVESANRAPLNSYVLADLQQQVGANSAFSMAVHCQWIDMLKAACMGMLCSHSQDEHSSLWQHLSCLLYSAPDTLVHTAAGSGLLCTHRLPPCNPRSTGSCPAC
jgi:hypothetical protein